MNEIIKSILQVIDLILQMEERRDGELLTTNLRGKVRPLGVECIVNSLEDL